MSTIILTGNPLTTVSAVADHPIIADDEAAALATAEALLTVEGDPATIAAPPADAAGDDAETVGAPADERPRGRRRGPLDCSPAALAAREAMITQHLPLVRYVANSMARHAGQSVLLDYDDLLSYGTEGLIAAVDSFDADRGLKFSTWAVMHIRTTIQDALRTLDPLPRSLRAKGKEIDRVAAALAHERGVWPELPTLAGALGQPLDALRKTLQDLGQSVVSLEQVDDGHNGAATGGDEGGFSLLNLLADEDPAVSPEESLDRQELSRLLQAAVAALPPREEVLVDAHYRRGQSMRQISRLLGISESRVSQLHARAVKLLREHLQQALALEATAPVSRPAGRRRGASRRSAGGLGSIRAA
jgi:RNA polymerase sigma factor for flagellar operon FliA